MLHALLNPAVLLHLLPVLLPLLPRLAVLRGNPGIPPLAGFLSKWTIAKALLTAPDGPLAKAGLCCLMYAAFMTAVYMLTVVARAFQPVPEGQLQGVHDPDWKMDVPIGLLAAAIIVLGLFSQPLLSLLTSIAAGQL